jgi:hypothetical protein
MTSDPVRRLTTVATYVAVLLALSALWAGCGGKRKAAATATTPQTRRKLNIVWQVGAGRYPVAAVYRSGSVWVASTAPAGARDGRLARLDSRNGSTMASIPVGWSPSGLAEGAGSIWVADSIGDGSRSRNGLPGLQDALSRINPRTNHVVATVHVPDVQSVAAGGGVVWATSASANHEAILRIDPADDRTKPVLRLPGASGPLIWGGGRLWALTWFTSPSQHARVSEIDPRSNRIVTSITIPGAGPFSALAYRANVLWVSALSTSSSSLRGRVFRIDTRSSRRIVMRPRSITSVMALALNGDGAWAAGDRSLSLLAERRGIPIAHLTLPADAPPTTQSVTSGVRTVWVLAGTRLLDIRLRTAH